jgi:hypothetical protein
MPPYLNSVQYLRVENVKTSVDFVGNKLLGLFNKSLNDARASLAHNNTIL